MMSQKYISFLIIKLKKKKIQAFQTEIRVTAKTQIG